MNLFSAMLAENNNLINQIMRNNECCFVNNGTFIKHTVRDWLEDNPNKYIK